ncbi:MAG: thermonuclease family protein [Anaerolineales bacterium]|nr:thermonuclease family protein [Anaerolineales bacterium]MCW5854748.1 thermonuclease family protein [Anaerolineales bacterium]
MKTKTFLTLALAALLLAACGSSGQADQDAVNTQVALLMEQQNAENQAPVEEAPEATQPAQDGPGVQGGVLLPPLPSDAGCVPNSTLRVLATVTEIVTGDAIMVRIDGREWEVRYIGIDSGDLPTDVNAQLVAGKEVMLISDEQDTDEWGRLPRYVVADGVFVNLELVRRGAAFVSAEEPNTACDNAFAQAAP